MKNLALEWIGKAEADFASARLLIRAKTHINYDLVCFLCQQTAEKYLKAFLQEHDISFPKTHDLSRLMRLCAEVNDVFLLQGDALLFLEDFSVRFRYPGDSADKRLANEALKRATTFRVFAKGALSSTDSN